MAKLFHVEVVYTAVVVARSEMDAHVVAYDNARAVVRDAMEPATRVKHVITTKADFRDGWDGGCIPYGLDGNTRIGEFDPELA